LVFQAFLDVGPMSENDTPPSLENLSARLKAAQDAVADKKSAERDTEEAAQGAGVGFRIGIELVAGVLVGAGLGWFIDSKFETSPIFMLACISLGFAASVLNVLRVLKNLDQSVGLGRAMRSKEGRDRDAAREAPPPSHKSFDDEDD
jgi:ATP synthase protein I